MARGEGGGRPPFEITEQVLKQIEQLAGYGLSIPQIAAVIGCSERTLKRGKADRPDVLASFMRGKAKAEGMIGKSLFERAKNGDVPAIKWWEMTRAGRSEKTSSETKLIMSHEDRLDELR